MLCHEYLTDLEHRAKRFSGAWTGTSGTLAAGIIHLLKERASMSQTIAELEAANAALRDAVETRLAGSPHTPEETEQTPPDWILRGQRELDEQRQEQKPLGCGIADATPGDLRPGSREFLQVLDELRNLHLRKTLDYGMDDDALANIRSSADVVNMPAWAGCILRISDKLHRLKAYFRRGRVEFDGVEDTLKDIACYAVIAEVLRRESP